MLRDENGEILTARQLQVTDLFERDHPSFDFGNPGINPDMCMNGFVLRDYLTIPLSFGPCNFDGRANCEVKFS